MSPIQYQIDRAHAAIDACGELSYLNRVALLRSFDDAPSKTTLGWVRRASLAIVCARECASFWTPAAVASFELGPVLDFAQACLRERRMFSELSDVAENLDLNVEDVLALGPSHFTAAYAGYATVAAARTVIRDETLDEETRMTERGDASGSGIWTGRFQASSRHDQRQFHGAGRPPCGSPDKTRRTSARHAPAASS